MASFRTNSTGSGQMMVWAAARGFRSWALAVLYRLLLGGSHLLAVGSNWNAELEPYQRMHAAVPLLRAVPLLVQANQSTEHGRDDGVAWVGVVLHAPPWEACCDWHWKIQALECVRITSEDFT